MSSPMISHSQTHNWLTSSLNPLHSITRSNLLPPSLNRNPFPQKWVVFDCPLPYILSIEAIPYTILPGNLAPSFALQPNWSPLLQGRGQWSGSRETAVWPDWPYRSGGSRWCRRFCGACESRNRSPNFSGNPRLSERRRWKTWWGSQETVSSLTWTWQIYVLNV